LFQEAKDFPTFTTKMNQFVLDYSLYRINTYQ